MAALKEWLAPHGAERWGEPKSSLGTASASLRGHGETLRRFLTVPGAPLDHHTGERALKLGSRQRKNSLFSAPQPSASLASLLSSGIATCLEAGVTALE